MLRTLVANSGVEYDECDIDIHDGWDLDAKVICCFT